MKKIIENLWIILDKKQWIKIFVLFLIMMFGAVIESVGIILLPTLLSGLMDITTFQSNPYISYLCSLFNIDVSESIRLLCFFLIGLYLFKGVYSSVQYRLLYAFINNNRFRMQSQLMNSYLHRDYSFYLYVHSGDVIQNLTNNVDFVFASISNLMNFMSEIVMVIAILVTIVLLNPVFSIGIGSVIFVLMLIVGHFIKPIMASEGKNVTNSYANMNKWIMQSVAGIKEIKIDRKEWFFQENYDKYAKIAAISRQKQGFLEQVPRIVYETLTMVGVLITLLIIVSLNGNFEDLIPQFAAFGIAIIKVIPSANRISSYRNSMEYYGQGIKEVSEFIHESQEAICNDLSTIKSDISAKCNGVRFTKECGLYEVSFKYPKSVEYVITKANMIIPHGKSIGIVGTSGSGKSTVADILLGLLKPQHGVVESDFVNIEKDYDGWLSRVGYIPQTIYMLDDTVMQNVVFGAKDEDVSTEKIWDALDEACIGDFIRSLPDGLNTNIGERGVRLSGGQRQRLGIARALFKAPEILVFDEATSALDNETEMAIIDSIENLHGKKTLVIIAHRLSTIEKCDLIYRVEDKKIILERGAI